MKSAQLVNINSYLVHLGTLWAPFRYPLSRCFLLKTQYLSLGGISDSFLHVARAWSRALQDCPVCRNPSDKVAITESTARSLNRCRRFRGGDILHGLFLVVVSNWMNWGQCTIRGRQGLAMLDGKVQTCPCWTMARVVVDHENLLSRKSVWIYKIYFRFDVRRSRSDWSFSWSQMAPHLFVAHRFNWDFTLTLTFTFNTTTWSSAP